MTAALDGASAASRPEEHPGARRRPLADSDLFAIALPRAPRVSPDGARVLFLLETADPKTDRTSRRLRVLSLADRAEHNFDEIGPILQARWVGNDRILVVLPDGDGASIATIGLDGGLVTLTALAVPPGLVEVSPDGAALALTAMVPWPQPRAPSLPACLDEAAGRQPARLIERTVWRIDGQGERKGADQLFVFDLRTRDLTQLTSELDWVGYFASGISWSADGSEIMLASNVSADREERPFTSSIYAVNIATRQRRCVIEGGQTSANISPCCAPRGDRLAFRSAQDSGAFHLVPTLWTATLGGGDLEQIADVDQDIGSIAWDWSGTGLYFSFVRNGSQELWHVASPGPMTRITRGLASDGAFDPDPYLGGGGEFCACPQGVIAVIAASDDPGRLVLFERGSSPVELYRPNAWLSDDVALGRVERLEANLPSGATLQSWLIYPPDYDPTRTYPLVLEIHGGPDQAFGGHFGFRAQRYATEGYIVLMPNYQGSSGTDQSLFAAGYRFPGNEHDELLAALDKATERACVDPNRLYISGLSAGGVLAAWTIGKSHRFAASAVRGPIVNWISHSLNWDLYSIYAGRLFTAAPWDDPMQYWQRSPLSAVADIKTPTLIVHGEVDCRTPMAEGLQLYHALRLRGVPAALLLLPDAGHVSTAPSQWLEEQFFILDWFGRHTMAVE